MTTAVTGTAAPTPLERTLRGNMPVLDALRGLAILLVIAHRAMVTPNPSGLVGRAVAAAMEAGWVGVQLFFVLSGFLITGILLDTPSAPATTARSSRGASCASFRSTTRCS